MTEPRKPRPRPAKPAPAEETPVEEAPVEPVEAAEPEPTPAPEPEPAAPAASATRPPKSALALEFKRTLSDGDHGPQVDRVIAALVAKGYDVGPVNGRYGSRVARQVRQFQSATGLHVTGSVNAATWEALLS